MRPTHPVPARDTALLLARLLLGTILFVRGHQALAALGRGDLEHVSIPVAIVSASVVTVVEVVGGLVLVAGLLTPAVAAGTAAVLVGAAAFLQVLNGSAPAHGGWELVGAIVVGLAALAAAGPGRFSLAHLLRARRARTAPAPVQPRPGGAHRPRHGAYGIHGSEAIPPAGLPLVPIVRVTAIAECSQPSGPVG